MASYKCKVLTLVLTFFLISLTFLRHQDSIGLSEQEIQEFKAGKTDVQFRRQELRDKLRDQFQKLCTNHITNGCRVCDVCT